MTREAKIGMLTGLGVIVLIGVLLSNYLGKNPSPRMASLPIGASYREQITQPVGVSSSPGEARGQAGIVPTPAYAVGEAPSAVATPEMGPSAMPGQPVVSSPVTPQ